MSVNKKYAGNPLGDLRAENDRVMLDAAFYKTPDYRTLIESNDKSIVVGRRGVGKSALVYQLEKYWSEEPDARKPLTLRLEKSQVFALIPYIEKFGRYRIQSAACEKCWKYALMLELLDLLHGVKMLQESNLLQSHLKVWRSSATEITARFRKLLEKVPDNCVSPEEKLAWLLDNLDFSKVDAEFSGIMQKTNKSFFILVDRLDEGYEPTSAGIGLVDGILNAVIELNSHYANIRAILFIRDNIFRTIAKKNPDFSANIEGQTLRLHWNDYHLMNMVTERLKKAFDAKETQSQKIWDRFAARELKGRDGFRHCLQMTLYRPRDILLLLNSAFYNATKEDRAEIIPSDVTEAGKSISVSRLEDLQKEYSSVIPGIDYLTKAFANQRPEFILEDANRILTPILQSPKYAGPIIQEFAILAEPIAALRSLYGIGFVGIKTSQGCYIFCHDGNSPGKEIVGDEKFSIHPCYWMSLNISGDPLSSSDAGEIYDEKDENEEDGKHGVKNEYKIKVTVTEPNIEQRNKKLSAHIAELDVIPLGQEGIAQFANWCQRAIQVVFPESLRDIVKKTPGHSKQSVFLEANNYASTCSWEILNDRFGCGKAIFCVCNQKPVPRDVLEELAEMARSINVQAAFLVTRENADDDFGHYLLPLLRENLKQKGVMILNITSKLLVSLLSKLRSQQKHDVAETTFNSLLNQYMKNHLKNAEQVCGRIANQSATINIAYPAKNCFGELGVDPTSGMHQISICQGNGGNKSLVAGPINLQPQAYQILETGFSDAKKCYIEEQSEKARLEGKSIMQSEIDLPPEKTLLLQWSQDDLAKIICHQDCWAVLKKNQKDQIKTAMSRLRKLFYFSNDPCCLITDFDNDCRRTTIPFRLAKS